MPSPKKKTRKSKIKKSKTSNKRHSRYVKSFIRKDGVYIKAHYRTVGGKRT